MDKIITISKATASGPTELSSFDAALYAMGVGNLNLIHLSSVIPMRFTVECETISTTNDINQGDRLYCVYAEKRVSEPGQTAAAGLGWVLTQEENPWGLFVEHTGHSEEEVQKQIELSLAAMMKYRNTYQWGKIHSEITAISYTHEPVCAIVLAKYQLQTW